MNNSLHLILNPFNKIAGVKALLAGFILMCATAIIGAYTNIIFDGVLDIHIASVNALTALVFVFTSWFILSIIVGVATKIMKLNYRLIDLFGTLALSRAPFLIAAILGIMAKPLMSVEQGNETLLTSGTIVFMVLTIPIIIWNIILTYNAIKVSCDVKGKSLTGLVILGILVAEVIVVALRSQIVSLTL